MLVRIAALPALVQPLEPGRGGCAGERSDRYAKQRMLQVRGDLAEWNQHKCPLMEMGMGNSQRWRGENQIVEEQNIQIDQPWTPACCRGAAQVCLKIFEE